MSGKEQGQMLKVGPNQVYQRDICKISGQVVGKGIYCSPNI